jgi:hypothetical protein
MNCQNLIFKFLTLINNNGNQEKYWIDLLFEIEKENYIFDFIIFIQNQLTISNNELLYDIIDFLVDFSSEKTVKLISKDNFLNTFISRLRKNARTSINLQKKIIFLIQKWGIKNKNYPNFKHKYDFLKKNGIVFPRIDFKLMTYDKYINVNSFKNNYNRKINQNKTNGDNLTFNNVNLGSENKKYNIIQYGNPYLNNSNNNQNINNDIIYNENTKNPIYLNNMSSINNNLSNSLLENPENIKNIWREKIRKYNEYINEGKYSSNFNNLKEGINELKDNISPMGNLIIQFSMMNNNEARHNMVNLRNDMEQTIYRYENLIRNNNVEPFYSSFDGNSKRYQINNPNIYSNNYNISDNSLKKNKIDVIKNGLYNFGSLIKEKSINGYEFVKEKIKGEDKNEKIENSDNNQKNNTPFNSYSTYNVNNNENEKKSIFSTVKVGLSKVGNSISNTFKKLENKK